MRIVLTQFGVQVRELADGSSALDFLDAESGIELSFVLLPDNRRKLRDLLDGKKPADIVPATSAALRGIVGKPPRPTG